MSIRVVVDFDDVDDEFKMNAERYGVSPDALIHSLIRLGMDTLSNIDPENPNPKDDEVCFQFWAWAKEFDAR